MNLYDLTIEHLQIPFKSAFSHASATRTQTDSVLIKSVTKHLTGYGESCPRLYVTRENYQSSLTFFNTFKSSIINSITDLNSLKLWVSEHQMEIDSHPAAWCAIELSLLDLLAKEQKCTVEDLLQLPILSSIFSYSAVLGDNKLDTFSTILEQHVTMGFKDYKIKISGDLTHDKAKCDLVKKRVPNALIRLDANNLWQNPKKVIEYIHALDHQFFALEEPLQVADYKNLTSIFKSTGIQIILDESFTKFQQFDLLKDNVSTWIINIRISKMGGLLRSLSIVNKAIKLGIPCIVGAQVGETSLLTRAALTLVNTYRDEIIAQEGGYGTYLLQNDIFDPIMMIGAGAIIPAKTINSLGPYGFGLNLK